MKYVVGTGWYSGGVHEPAGGCVRTRSPEFHKLWRRCIDRYSEPAKIVVIDSASPVPLETDAEYVRLDDNYQYNFHAKLRGWARGFMLGAMYAFFCDADFFYVEQDCLAIGDWAAQCYGAHAPLLCGSPKRPGCDRTPWSVQTSFVYIAKHAIPDVVHGFIRSDDPACENALASCGVPVKYLPFGYGRLRPFNLADSALELHFLTDEELTMVERSGRV